MSLFQNHLHVGISEYGMWVDRDCRSTVQVFNHWDGKLTVQVFNLHELKHYVRASNFLLSKNRNKDIFMNIFTSVQQCNSPSTITVGPKRRWIKHCHEVIGTPPRFLGTLIPLPERFPPAKKRAEFLLLGSTSCMSVQPLEDPQVENVYTNLPTLSMLY